MQYYERLRDDHEDRSYRFLSDMVNKAIREERHLKNQQWLVNDASGKSLVAAPGTVKSRGDATKPKRERDGKGFGDRRPAMPKRAAQTRTTTMPLA